MTWDMLVRREGNVISALATVNFDFADFEIVPPDFAGFGSVDDDVTLQVRRIAELGLSAIRFPDGCWRAVSA